MAKIISKYFKGETKCPACNWGFSTLYNLDSFPEDQYVCSFCFLEYLMSIGIEIEIPK